MELLANETTLNQVAPLVEYAFNKSASVTSDPHFMNRYRHAWLYGHYTDEVLSNFVMANQFHVAFHGGVPSNGRHWLCRFLAGISRQRRDDPLV